MIVYNHDNNDDAHRLNLQTVDAVDIPITINVNLALADTVRATYNVTRYALSWLTSSFIGHDVGCVDIPSLPTHTQLASGTPSAFDVKVTNSLSMATVGGVDYAAYTATGKTYGETPPFPHRTMLAF